MDSVSHHKFLSNILVYDQVSTKLMASPPTSLNIAFSTNYQILYLLNIMHCHFEHVIMLMLAFNTIVSEYSLLLRTAGMAVDWLLVLFILN